VKHYFLFKLSAEDAKLMAHELSDVSPEDILNLDMHSCYVKLVHQHQQQPTFSLYLERPPMGDRQMIDLIRLRNRRYGRPATEVDQELFVALPRTLQAAPKQEPSERGSNARRHPKHHQTQTEREQQNQPKHQKGDTMSTAIVESTIVDQTTAKSTEEQHPSASTMTEETVTPPRTQKKGYVRFQGKNKQKKDTSKALITTFDIYPEEISPEEEGNEGDLHEQEHEEA
jgi:hypothetical protein